MQKKVEEQATIKIDFRGQHNEIFLGFKVKINMPESRQLKNWYEREFLCAILEEKRKKNMYYKTWCVQGAMGKGNNNISIPEKEKYRTI